MKVIYDAAHAFGVKYKRQASASFGDASMFSFHATKVFNTIEGGCVCFKDDSWVQLLNDMKNFGIHGPESVEFVGGNAKMNEFQAAMGLCNLRHLDEEIDKRKKVVERYRERLEGVEGIKLSKIQEGNDRSRSTQAHQDWRGPPFLRCSERRTGQEHKHSGHAAQSADGER